MEESGVLKILFVAGSNFRLAAGGSAFTGSIDNVSVKEITNAVEYKNIPQSARELYSLEDDTWVSNELVVNGDFATDSDWNLVGEASISNGHGNIYSSTGNNSFLQQSNIMNEGSRYILTYDIISADVGDFKISAVSNSTMSKQIGPNTIEFTALSSSLLLQRSGNNPTNIVIDNVSVKETIEVADFIEPVTQGMTLTEAWTTRGTAYNTLGNATSASVRVDATISNTDSGILMESGASGLGLILYVYSGVLYFQCGKGNGYGTVSDRAEVSYVLPIGESDYIIEWSADTSNAVLYVNGLLIASQTFSVFQITGGDGGTLGEVKGLVAVNRGGWTTNGAGVYTNTITKCDIFNNQITSDV